MAIGGGVNSMYVDRGVDRGVGGSCEERDLGKRSPKVSWYRRAGVIGLWRGGGKEARR